MPEQNKGLDYGFGRPRNKPLTSEMLKEKPASDSPRVAPGDALPVESEIDQAWRLSSDGQG